MSALGTYTLSEREVDQYTQVTWSPYKRLLVKQREKYDKRVEANPRKWLLQLSNRSRYKVLLLKVLARPPYILLVYCRVIQSTRMLQNILVIRWIRKKEYVSQSWEIKERKGKDTSVQKGVEGKRRKSTVRWVKGIVRERVKVSQDESRSKRIIKEWTWPQEL